MFPYNPLGWIENSTVRFRRRSPWLGRTRRRSGLRDEEHLGVSGERYFAVPSQVLLLCNLQRSLNALGLLRHAETSSAASYWTALLTISRPAVRKADHPSSSSLTSSLRSTD